jgi:RimJ/RimL family protein N-acetyltransferase
VLTYGAQTLALARVVAIVSPGNERSERLLSKLGFRHETNVRLQDDSEELALYASAG